MVKGMGQKCKIFSCGHRRKKKKKQVENAENRNRVSAEKNER